MNVPIRVSSEAKQSTHWTLPVWALLSVCMLLTEGGCLVVPIPPPTMTPTSLTRAAPGQVVVDAGFSPTVGSGGEPVAAAFNFAGMVPLTAKYGINDQLDVSASWGALSILRRSVGTQLGIKLLERPEGRLGMTAGLGLYEHDGTITTGGGPVVDANGNPVYDEQGNPVYEPSVETPYLVLGLAPALGLTAERRFLPWLKGVGAVRASYSQTFVVYGEVPTAGAFFIEPELGLVAEPLTGLSVGLGLGLGWPMLPSVVTSGSSSIPFVPTLSLSYVLPIPKRATASRP